MSLESRYGWYDLRLAMEAWPERILEARSQGHWERDELDFYLCFFVQCWSLIDWARNTKLIAEDELQLAWKSRDSMRLCQEIANRYKHLTLKFEKYDRNWSIWLDHDHNPKVFLITAKGQNYVLWELMMDCIAFWEEVAAGYHLDRGNSRVFRPG